MFVRISFRQSKTPKSTRRVRKTDRYVEKLTIIYLQFFFFFCIIDMKINIIYRIRVRPDRWFLQNVTIKEIRSHCTPILVT